MILSALIFSLFTFAQNPAKAPCENKSILQIKLKKATNELERRQCAKIFMDLKRYIDPRDFSLAPRSSGRISPVQARNFSICKTHFHSREAIAQEWKEADSCAYKSTQARQD